MKQLRYQGAPRPTALTIMAIVSLVSSVGTVLGVILRILVATVLSAAALTLGPIVGLVGSVAGLWLIILSVLGSLLGILLFSAGLHTLDGDPRGREQHRLWAWIVIGLDVFRYLAGSDLSKLDQWTLIYAFIVLYVTGLPETLAYFGNATGGKPRPPVDYLD